MTTIVKTVELGKRYGTAKHANEMCIVAAKSRLPTRGTKRESWSIRALTRTCGHAYSGVERDEHAHTLRSTCLGFEFGIRVFRDARGCCARGCTTRGRTQTHDDTLQVHGTFDGYHAVRG